MVSDKFISSSIPEKERWWTALSYFFSPILPSVFLYIFDLEDYPFLKQHIYQALIMGILFVLTMPLILAATLFIGGLFWLVMPYWAILAYNGQAVSIPWITAWIKDQGWV